MKKKVGIILIIVTVILITFSFMRGYTWPVDQCCICNTDSWILGSGIYAEIIHSQQKYRGTCDCSLFGCARSSHMIPFDYLLIAGGLLWYGVYLLKKKDKIDEYKK